MLIASRRLESVMPLTPGTTLGPYRVTAKIGEGGMGEVYRVRDTKLDRDVALKVLPQAFTAPTTCTELPPAGPVPVFLSSTCPRAAADTPDNVP